MSRSFFSPWRAVFTILAALTPLLEGASAKEPDLAFRFHLISEPHSLDPIQMRGAAGSYLFYNVYRSLYRLNSKGDLIPEGAKNCSWTTPKKLVCQLNKHFKWSNGSPVSAYDYAKTFQRIVSKEGRSVLADLIVNLKNAKNILAGKGSSNSLGVVASGNNKIEFLFDHPDPEFLYKLSNPGLSPTAPLIEVPNRSNASKMLFNGPYQISEWIVGKKIILSRNPHYPLNSKADFIQKVEALIIEDDHTALRLFETQRIDFLRRLPSSKIEHYKNRKGFLQLPVARFDYIGFNLESVPDVESRRLFAESLKYSELQKLYQALGRPGCPSLPKTYMDTIPCFSFKNGRASDTKFKKRYSLGYSLLGGEDIKRGMEWLQHQWKIHLGANVSLSPYERGHFLSGLKSSPTDLFRKGVGLDRPTCLAALEIFTSDHPENFIRLKSKIYDNIASSLASSKNKQQAKKLCSRGIQYLIDNAHIIPLGEIHFTMLHNDLFKGWYLTPLNQFDLTHLKAKVVSK